MAAVILLMSFLAIDPTPFSEPKDPVLSCSWLFVGNQVTHLRRPPPHITTSPRLESSWIDIVIRIDSQLPGTLRHSNPVNEDDYRSDNLLDILARIYG
jgi:hypothetical protein